MKHVKTTLAIFVLLIAMGLSCPVQAAGVARIGKKSYRTLEKAFEAVKNKQTIVVKKNIVLKKPVYIKKNKKITLDLKGHTIKLKYTSKKVKEYGRTILYSNYGIFRIEKGNLTVKNGKIKGTKWADILFDVDKKAALNIKSGTYDGMIQNHGKLTVYKGNFSDTIRYNENLIFNFGTVKIKGGKFTGGKEQECLIYNADKCNISGGTFSTKGNGCVDCLRNYGHKKDAYLTVTGGTFISPEYAALQASSKGCNVTIKGGTIKGDLMATDKGSIVMSGGKMTGLVRTNPGSTFKMTGGSVTANGPSSTNEHSVNAYTGLGKAVLIKGTMTGGYTFTSEDEDAIRITHRPVIDSNKANVTVGSGFKIINRGRGSDIFDGYEGKTIFKSK